MDSEIFLLGKKYISSRRCAELFGYTNDYIGKLCREGKVLGKIVSRTWYVEEESIKDYAHVASSGSYISSKQATKISGYSQDYISRLCREGKIEGKLLHGFWYIDQESLKGYLEGASKVKEIRGEEMSEIAKEEYRRNLSSTTPVVAKATVESTASDVETLIPLLNKDVFVAPALKVATEIISTGTPTHQEIKLSSLGERVVTFALIFTLVFGSYFLKDSQIARAGYEEITKGLPKMLRGLAVGSYDIVAAIKDEGLLAFSRDAAREIVAQTNGLVVASRGLTLASVLGTQTATSSSNSISLASFFSGTLQTLSNAATSAKTTFLSLFTPSTTSNTIDLALEQKRIDARIEEVQ